MDTEHITLPSGANVLYTAAPGTATYKLRLHVLVGHCDGISVMPGLAHMVEHLMACGKSAVFESHQLDAVAKKLFYTTLNASTGADRSSFAIGDQIYGSIGLFPDQLSGTLLTLVRHFTSLEFTDEDLAREKLRIKDEIIMRDGPNSNPFDRENYKLANRAWPGTAVGTPYSIVGDPDTPARTTRQMLEDFYKLHYQNPAKWVISVTGPERPSDELLKAVNSLFDGFESSPVTPHKPAATARTQHHYNPIITETRHDELLLLRAFLEKRFPGDPAIVEEQVAIHREYLDSQKRAGQGDGQGEERESFLELRVQLPTERTLRETMVVGIFTSMVYDFLAAERLRDPTKYATQFNVSCGAISATGGLQLMYSDRTDTLDRVQRFSDYIKGIRDEPDTEQFDRIKTAAKHGLAFRELSPSSVADSAINMLCSYGQVTSLAEQLAIYESVTIDEVQRVAAGVLSGNVALLNRALPEQRIHLDEIEEIFSAPVPGGRPDASAVLDSATAPGKSAVSRPA